MVYARPMWVLVRVPGADVVLNVGILDVMRPRRQERVRREPMDTTDGLHLKNVFGSDELSRILGEHDSVKVIFERRVLALFEPGVVEDLAPGDPLHHVVVRALRPS